MFRKKHHKHRHRHCINTVAITIVITIITANRLKQPRGKLAG